MEPLRIGFIGTTAPHSFMFLDTPRLMPEAVERIALWRQATALSKVPLALRGWSFLRCFARLELRNKRGVASRAPLYLRPTARYIMGVCAADGFVARRALG